MDATIDNELPTHGKKFSFYFDFTTTGNRCQEYHINNT